MDGSSSCSKQGQLAFVALLLLLGSKANGISRLLLFVLNGENQKCPRTNGRRAGSRARARFPGFSRDTAVTLTAAKIT